MKTNADRLLKSGYTHLNKDYYTKWLYGDGSQRVLTVVKAVEITSKMPFAHVIYSPNKEALKSQIAEYVEEYFKGDKSLEDSIFNYMISEHEKNS